MKRFLFGLFIVNYIGTSFALSWQDLWLRRDQQGDQLFKAGLHEQAAQRFHDPNWQGVAYYRAKKYQEALQKFQQGSDARSYYNQGNTFARLGDYQTAIEAYNRALALQPIFPDAKYNRELLKKRLKEKAKTQQAQQGNTQQQKKQPSEKSSSSSQQAQNDKTLEKKQQGADQQAQKKEQQAATEKKQQEKSGKNQAQNSQWRQQQANQQQLDQIPDDPGGLLRQKFLRDYLRRRQTATKRG